MTYVKICGIQDPAHAVAAAAAGADFIGMILVAEARRRVTPEQAKVIVDAVRRETHPVSFASASFEPPPDDVEGWFRYSASQLAAQIEARRPLFAGVFVAAAAWIVNEFVEEIGLDVAQHSDGDNWHYCLEVNRPTIKAVHVLDNDTPDTVIGRMEAGMADLVLLDSRAGDRMGGTGATFDWSIARGIAQRMPVVLAGGLTPENVGEAIRTVRPFAVDVSSGVETAGVKDPHKIRAFIEAVRAADAGGSS